MYDKKSNNMCVSCENTEETIPLVAISYKGKETWTCFNCLPQLLHGKKEFKEIL